MKDRKGIALMECLVYMGIMLIALEFVFFVYFDTDTMIRINGRLVEQVDAAGTFTDSIRHDVRGCSAILPSYGVMTQSADRLILAFPDKVTIYEFDNSRHVMKKTDIRGNERTITGKWNCSKVFFARDLKSPGTVLISFVPPVKKKIAPLSGISVRTRIRNGA